MPLRSNGSLSMNRSLMAAGLVDYLQVTLFPVISGRTGAEPILGGAADFDLELVEQQTLDGHTQERPLGSDAGSDVVSLNQLHEVAAGVVEDSRRHRTELDRILRERDAEVAEPGVLGNDVVDEERGEGDAIVDEGGLERLCRWMLVGLQQKLDAVAVLR